MPGRRAKRFDLAQVIPVAVEAGARRFLGVVMDISSTGVLVRCDDLLPTGAIAQLAIGKDRESVRTLAVVRRVVPGIGLGFEFRNMSITNRDFLNRLLRHLSHESIVRGSGP